jgi:amino-acid N-acetyltransferase
MTASDRVTLRAAEPADATALHALISSHLDEGRLLPRHLDEIAVHASRFIVAVCRRKIIGCAELAPLSSQLAEVRSLVVHPSARRQRLGTEIVRGILLRARRAGYDRLCVLTHAPEYFLDFGFSIVPHLWVQEKVFTDCVTCPKFRACGQVAMVAPLVTSEVHDHAEVAAVLHCA